LLADISIERIMQEFKHILAHPHALKAFRAMEETAITETISDLAEGIRFLSKQNTFSLDYFQFYALCFFLHGSEIGDDWRFSNKERQIIGQLITLLEVTENDRFTEELVFAYGKELCLRANEIGRLLCPESDQEARIVEVDEGLPIRKTCDLMFKGQDILENTDVKDARIIGEVVSDLVLMVITRQLPNEYETLKTHALKKIKELESEGNEHGN
jgi:tRNA nucleotidyltransferase/poly(A) polymerase